MPWHCFVVSVVVCFFVLQYFFVWYLKQRIKIPDTCRNDMSGLSLSYKDATCSKTWARSSPFSSTRSTMFLYGKLFTIWPYVIAPEKKWSFKDCNSYRRGNNFVRSTPLKGTLWKVSEEREIEKQAWYITESFRQTMKKARRERYFVQLCAICWRPNIFEAMPKIITDSNDSNGLNKHFPHVITLENYCVNYWCLTEINFRYKGHSLMRTPTRGPYSVLFKGSWLHSNFQGFIITPLVGLI